MQVVVRRVEVIAIGNRSRYRVGSDWIVTSSRVAFSSKILFSSTRSLVQVVLSGGEENPLHTCFNGRPSPFASEPAAVTPQVIQWAGNSSKISKTHAQDKASKCYPIGLQVAGSICGVLGVQVIYTHCFTDCVGCV